MAVIEFQRRDNADPSNIDDDDRVTYTPMMSSLITALIALMLAGLIISGALFYLRWRRRRIAALRLEANLEAQTAFNSSSTRQMTQNASLRAPGMPSHHRRNKSLTTPPQSPIFVVSNHDDSDSILDEKRWGSARNGSVPSIHLTFPEEVDAMTGKRDSKVMVVTVSEKGGVGLEPFKQEALPPYREHDNTMKSLDLERIGGLRDQKN